MTPNNQAPLPKSTSNGEKCSSNQTWSDGHRTYSLSFSMRPRPHEPSHPSSLSFPSSTQQVNHRQWVPQQLIEQYKSKFGGLSVLGEQLSSRAGEHTMLIVPERWRNQWKEEQVRVLVLCSLSIQVGLIFLAPLRKRSANKALLLTLWLFYLTADNVATLALGNILSKETDMVSDVELTALWAPFLLLHLGGPDPITSYSVEDNELWWRHLLGLIIQVVTAGFVFLQSLPNTGLWVPMLFVFVLGLLKFVERTLALRAASMDNFKDKIISENLTNSIDFISSSSNMVDGSECELILEGYRWFGIFKRLLVDVTFSSKMLIGSQDRFSEFSAKQALKIVTIELSFLYDTLHTKAVMVHCIFGRLVRLCSLVSIVAALITFHHLEKSKFRSTDITVTYILFGVGISLEVVAAVLLVVSDWTIVAVSKNQRPNRLGNAIVGIVKRILRNEKPRWSSTVGQCSLIAFCLRDVRDTPIGRIMRYVRIKRAWDIMCTTKMARIPDFLQEMMFIEAKRRAQNVHIYRVLVEARSYRGSKALERHDQLQSLEWSMKKEFDECVILWHIATDICFFHTDAAVPTNNRNVNNVDSERLASMKTSNYMVYLLTQQPSMMQLGFGKTHFDSTCAVVKRILKAVVIDGERSLADPQSSRNVLEKPVIKMDGDDEKGVSLLSESCRLAKELLDLDQKKRWQIISETWMEMLGYAAIHCGSYQHARALSRGGELLTHFWLLMAQMGVVQEHKIQQYQSGSV